MSLLTRLVDPQPGEESLPIHQFMAALAEYKRGVQGVNLNSIAAGFGLSQQEANQLQQFITNLDQNTINREKIHDVLMLGSYPSQLGGMLYPLAKVKTELGLT